MSAAMTAAMAGGGGRRKARHGRMLAAGIALMSFGPAWATPHIPPSDTEVLAELPTGARHAANTPAAALASTRLDVALPLAQFDVSRARATGDLRFLGYAEAVLAPWMQKTNVDPQVLVLHATILQSRHAFDASLGELDQALRANPRDPQAWLTRATVLRVLGRYSEATLACRHLADEAGAAITALCTHSLRGLAGHLSEAYEAIAALPAQELPPAVRAWRYSELAEMAERLDRDEAAEHWFREGLQTAPEDFYMRTAYADLLLRHDRPAETLALLAGRESMEPMLLRAALAHRQLDDGASTEAEAALSSAFEVEARRGDAVHRREQARFLLDVSRQPLAALAAAEEDWKVQREPDDILILLRAAQASNQPQAARGALEFLRQTGLEDRRLDPYRGMK